MSTNETRPAPQAINIPGKLIDRYPTNRVPAEEAVKQMAESIREHGILQPVTVRATEGGRYQLIFGETRWKGALRVKPNFAVPAIVLDCDDKQAARIHAVENFQRVDLDEIEEAEAMANMRDQGWTVAEIAAAVGRTAETIYTRLRLLKLPPAAREAVRDNNLTLQTADKLLALPEALQAEALEEIIRPAHSAKALSEREAITMLERDYLLPIRLEEEWTAKRAFAEAENPGAKWLPYAEAAACRRWDSDYTEADGYPHRNVLSAAAQAEELVVPTWEDLAARHGATVWLGMDHEGAVVRFVQADPIIAAERAACDANPGDCIFEHEGAAQQAAAARERGRMEREAERVALAAERLAVYRVLSDAATPLTKTAAKKATALVLEVLIGNGYSENLIEVFGIPAGSDRGEAEEEAQKAARKFLADKAQTPLEALARLMMAVELTSIYHAGEFGALALDGGLVKAWQVPLLAAARDALKAAEELAEAEQKRLHEEEVLNG